jgi:predicted nicotinamide N-methyase
MSKPRVSELVAAQQKKYVTYVFPAKSGQDERAITLLESRTVISASGTTGLRTWEAALHLGTFLATKGASYVDGKCVLELGSGTGLIAALCARHMNARYVLATDGSPEVVEALEENMFLNGLEDEYLVKSRLLRWGRYLDDDNEGGEERHFNTVLGADVVKYRIPCSSNCQYRSHTC